MNAVVGLMKNRTIMKLKNITIFTALVLFFGACTNDYSNIEVTEVPQDPNKTVIVNGFEGAMEGELIIKFRPEVTAILDRTLTRSAQANKAGAYGAVMTRSGITDVDHVLDIIGSYNIERVFPMNKSEEETRKSGLHLWYIVRFDNNTDIRNAAEELSSVGEIAKIQYSHELKRREDQRPTTIAPAIKASMNTRQSNSFFNDPGLPKQWHYINSGDESLVPGSKAGSDVNCGEAWKKSTGNPSIIVAVMDEGVMWPHPDLEANMWVNEDEIFKSDKDNDGNGYNGDVYGYNFAEMTPVISWSHERDTGHGTHVAGTIAAVNNNGIGVSGIAGGSGSNDGVKIMSVQIFSGQFGVNQYNEARAIKYAADNGAVILQCSWGYNSSLSDPSSSMRGYVNDEHWARHCPLEKEALDYFIHNAGSPNGPIDGGLAIFAAGNEYAAAAGYPGAYGDFICVSAMDAGFMPASYTNYGRGVDIMAPGGDSDYHKTVAGSILSTMPPALTGGTGYGYMDGTSMACPHVSGVAALGLSYATKLRKKFTANQFKDLLLQSTRSLEPHFPINKLYYKFFSLAGESNPVLMELDKYYAGKVGAGMIDAGKLLTLVENNGVTLDLPNMYVALGVDNKQTIDLSLFFDGGKSLTFKAESANPKIASVSIQGSKLIITGNAIGTTAYTVTASDGKKQVAEITVRRNANGNGWL